MYFKWFFCPSVLHPSNESWLPRHYAWDREYTRMCAAQTLTYLGAYAISFVLLESSNSA